MFKKKQAQFSVSIPYELGEGKLWIRTIVWPERCPCCGESDAAALGKHKYTHKARYSQSSTGTQTTTSSYPLDWEVPYCPACQKHMKIAENWKYGLVAVCFFVPLILALAVDASSTKLILIFYGAFIAGGLLLYRVIVATLVKARLTAKCLGHGMAFWASSPPIDDHRIVFNFNSREYAQTFADLNQAQLEIHS